MIFHRIRNTLSTAIDSRINAVPAQGMNDVKTYFGLCGTNVSTFDWRTTLHAVQASKSITDIQTALANMQAQQRDELLIHSNEPLHQAGAISLFPMGYLLDRTIRLLFLMERDKHSKEFVHILSALDSANKDDAVSHCVPQTYRMADGKTDQAQMRNLLTKAENTFGGAYAGAFCMIQKVFLLNPSLPNPAFQQPKPPQSGRQAPIPPRA